MDSTARWASVAGSWAFRREARPTYQAAWRVHGQRQRSPHHLAAVHDHGVPNDERGRVRTQPDHSRGNLLRLPHPPHGLLRDHYFPPIGRAPGEPLHHRGVDDPGAHSIDTDVRLRVVEGRHPGETDHAVLRSSVSSLTFETFDPAARGGVHNRAASCSSISGISYFMHRSTPRRLTSTIRSHSSSVLLTPELVVVEHRFMRLRR